MDVKSEYKSTILAVFAAVKPCCILMWVIAFVGAGAGAGSAIDHFGSIVDLVLLLAIGLPCILYSLYKISKALVWCSKNPATANWGLARLNASIVIAASALYIVMFAHSPLFAGTATMAHHHHH
ncbi:MAG TPA: hypothetical protein VMU07_03500 [Candidatus Paceibacterota bacterium]|nr:hypothetical protein [Candidatus Paceibacterota bacterium]